MRKNLILNTDSYKLSHFLQYPPGTEYVSSYVESRGGDYSKTLFFGLQMFIHDYLLDPISLGDIQLAEEIIPAHGLPFNKAGWMHILKKHGGHLPLRIQAVKEGTVLPTRNVLVQVINTDPAVPWLVSYIETAMLRAVWYPTTVATRSWNIKQSIKMYLDATSDKPDELLPFKLHDFGARGVSSEESAGIGGAAHLVNFMGTDTISAIMAIRRHYGHETPMPGFSIPASEHSTITSWGRTNEAQAFSNMIDQFGGPGKIFAVVSDSYDIMNAVDIWGSELKAQVLSNGGTLVVRPDSGDPVQTPVAVIEALMNKFGYTNNNKGYKVLPDCVRVIQGDGINEVSIVSILGGLMKRKIAADNIAFGMGGELLQTENRDTLKFAMKASAIRLKNGDWKDVYKDPAGDHGKQSKRGRLALIQRTSDLPLETIREEDLIEHFDIDGGDVTGYTEYKNLLQDVYFNGRALNFQNFDEVRAQANATSV